MAMAQASKAMGAKYPREAARVAGTTKTAAPMEALMVLAAKPQVPTIRKRPASRRFSAIAYSSTGPRALRCLWECCAFGAARMRSTDSLIFAAGWNSLAHRALPTRKPLNGRFTKGPLCNATSSPFSGNFRVADNPEISRRFDGCLFIKQAYWARHAPARTVTR